MKYNMLKKIIIIEGENSIQCDNLEDVVKQLIHENFYNLTEVEKNHVMKMKAFANCINNNMKILEKNEVKEYDNLDRIFLIKDEITYILSLLKTNNILLLEHKDSNIFTKEVNKEKLENNYVVVNKFARKLLEKYISEN